MKKKSPPKKIKAILFDFGRVLVDFNFAPAFRRLSRVTSLTPGEIEDFFTRSGLEVLFDGGKISSSQFYREVKKGLKHPLDYTKFKKVWNEIFTPKLKMIKLVKKLGSHYRLVLISNTNAMHYRHIRQKYSVLNHFDQIIVSFKEKVRKPDERIYRRAIRACRAKPEEIFYIDDRQDLTEAARALGFNTFTFKNNPDALIQKLKDLKIEKI